MISRSGVAIHNRLHSIVRQLTPPTQPVDRRLDAFSSNRFQLHSSLLHSSSRSSAPVSLTKYFTKMSNQAIQTPATIDLRQLLSVCYELSQHAGESIRRIFDSGNLGAIDKDPSHPQSASSPGQFGNINDPQTLADLESQRVIIGNLIRLYGPDLKIVGEEGELDNCTGSDLLYREARKDLFEKEQFPEELTKLDTKDITVWIDPLDGTKEFTLGFVHYVTVLIGISYRNRAIGGVVHVPFIGGDYVQRHDPLNPTHRPPPKQAKPGKTIWGAVGFGVRGSELADLSTIPNSRRFITTTRSHFSDKLKSVLDTLKPEAIIRCGGAGSKGLLVLSGDADAYLYPQTGTKRWDTAAIDALIKAAGGTFTDQYGDEIVYDANLPPENTTGLLGTMRDHQLYLLPKPNSNSTHSSSLQPKAEPHNKAAAL
mgnify:CR=1 FL=1